ncbi:MAG: hypothetical protein ACR2IF_13380 [Terriglobales bacterium]
MIIRHGEYRAEIKKATRDKGLYVYRVFRGEGTKHVAWGRERDCNAAVHKAEQAISEYLKRDAQTRHNDEEKLRLAG